MLMNRLGLPKLLLRKLCLQTTESHPIQLIFVVFFIFKTTESHPTQLIFILFFRNTFQQDP